MSPATVGLQYSREASRGQVVLLPATATPLGKNQFLNFKMYNLNHIKSKMKLKNQIN